MDKEKNTNQETVMFAEYGDIVSVDDVMKIMGYSSSWVNLTNLK